MEPTLLSPPRFASFRRWVCLAVLAPALGMANPAGETLRFGDVDFVRNGSRLDVIQRSNRAIIDWSSFSIANGETTDFSQPGASSAALNRVTGVSASQIDGLLRSNGRILLLNPNGIVIGPNGRVDTASFVASTLDISDADFLAGGDLPLRGASEAAVINLGTISAFDGDVFLVAAVVENHGNIFAPNGTTGLAAGNDVLIRESGEERVWVRGASGGTKENGVVNTGTVDANVAELKSYNGNIYGMAVKNEGRVAATGVTKQGGQIFLSAGGGKSKIRSTGALIAKNPTTKSGGKISIRNSGAESVTEVGGTVDAGSSEVGGTGGDVVILGTRIDVLPDTVILADGESGGGRVQIGGGRRGENPDFNNAAFVSVSDGVEINASATGDGDGGEVILFATDTLDFYGHASVRGGELSGDGGFVELSGKRKVNFNGFVNAADTRAANGVNGSLLFDPIDVTILASGPPPTGVIITPVTDSQTLLSASDIADFLENSGSLEIRTDGGESGVGDILLEPFADITWTSANDLKLFAEGTISMASDSVISSQLGNIHLENVVGSNNDGITGTQVGISLTNRAGIRSAGGDITLIGTGNSDGIGHASGVFLGNLSSVSTLGEGNITIKGTAGVSDGSNLAQGVQIGLAGVSAENGKIFIEGFGKGDAADGGSVGVSIGLSSVSTTGGDILIKGHGGRGSDGNMGVSISGYTMESVSGNFEIEGFGGTGDNSDGVRIQDSTLRTRDQGALSIKGTTLESPSGGFGTFAASPEASSGVSLSNVVIDSHGDLTVSGTGNGDVGIGMSGSTLSSDTGRLQLDGASNNGTAMHFDNLAATTIELVSRGGAVTIASTGGLDAGALVLRDESLMGADFTLDSGSIDIGSVTTESTIGSLSLASSDRFTVSNVDASGDLNFQAETAIDFEGGTHTNGNITVAATTINVTGDVSADGNFNSSGSPTAYSHHEFNLSGSVFATTTTLSSGYLGGTFNVDGRGLAGSDIRFVGDIDSDVINVKREFDLNKIKFSDIETIRGVGPDSSLIGMHTDQSYLIQNENEIVNDGFVFSDFATLRTGRSSDTITIAASALGGPFIDDMGGIDRLITAAGVNDVFVIDEDNEGTLNGIFEFGGIEILDANSGDDEFIVKMAATSEQFIGGSGFDRVTAFGAYEIGSVLLSSIEEIRGGGSNDILASPNFEPAAGTVAGNDRFTLTSDGKVRHDGIDYLGFEQVWTGDGNDTVTVQNGFSAPIRLRSFGGTDTLQGGNTTNQFTISSPSGGRLNDTIRFDDFERLIGGSSADTFLFQNQATVENVDGGAGRDVLAIDDRNLRGTNEYTVTRGRISRNPQYNFENVEAVQMSLGPGDDTVYASDLNYDYNVDGGAGFDTLRTNPLYTLDGNPIRLNGRSVTYQNFEAPFASGADLDASDDPGGLLQQQLGEDQSAQHSQAAGNFEIENRYNDAGSTPPPPTMNQLGLGNGGGGFAAAPAALAAVINAGQAVVVLLDGDAYLLDAPASLDGAFAIPSLDTIKLLRENLSPEANGELARALGYSGGAYLIMVDGAYAIDLSGAAPPEVMARLEANLTAEAAKELFAALDALVSIPITNIDGAISIGFVVVAPNAATAQALLDQLDDAAENELRTALGE